MLTTPLANQYFMKACLLFSNILLPPSQPLTIYLLHELSLTVLDAHLA